MSREVIAELMDISKIYYIGKSISVKALDGINLKIYRGDILIIMGPSGSGKSTLMNILGTLDRPTTGRVIIEDVDVTDFSEKELYKFRLRNIGFVFQFFNLIGTLTAVENVMLPMILLGNLDEKTARSKATELLKIVGMGEKLNARPTQLSGGQQQRVAIARALANDPSLILMDEPTGNVDMMSEAIILKLIKILNKYLGITFVIVTHNPEVSMIGTRMISIRNGRLFETQEVPKLNIDEALDEKEILALQLEFFEKEIKSLKNLLRKGMISEDEYKMGLNKVRSRLLRIRQMIGDIHG
ncbi:MAG: ABC transporter ATP-binding protein [Thermofilum sp. ex4484_79]|nr:MAG: ABC transporter ATP-binding protein [Thermofilum sp. ex4484_79]